MTRFLPLACEHGVFYKNLFIYTLENFRIYILNLDTMETYKSDYYIGNVDQLCLVHETYIFARIINKNVTSLYEIFSDGSIQHVINAIIQMNHNGIVWRRDYEAGIYLPATREVRLITDECYAISYSDKAVLFTCRDRLIFPFLGFRQIAILLHPLIADVNINELPEMKNHFPLPTVKPQGRRIQYNVPKSHYHIRDYCNITGIWDHRYSIRLRIILGKNGFTCCELYIPPELTSMIISYA